MPWTLIGADQAKLAVGGMLARGRLPHALLLSGPSGGGKRTMALDIAKAVNCLSPSPDGSPCQECLPCRKVESGIHPDVMLLSPKGKAAIIPIDSVRELRERLTFRPYEGRMKVSVITHAESLSTDSGGALLKTLEEPTDETLIILTAASASMVMGTLVSRCVTLRLPPLPRGRLLSALAERRGLTGGPAALLAGLAHGALGKALDLDLEAAQAAWAALEEVFGAPTALTRLKIARGLSERLIEEMGAKKDGGGDPREWERPALDLFVVAARLWFRDSLVLRATGDPGLLEGPPPSRALLDHAMSSPLRRLSGREAALARLVDGLSRSIRADILFEGFWLSVL
jgi:DNA polymerase III delta' subunit